MVSNTVALVDYTSSGVYLGGCEGMSLGALCN